MTVDTRRRILCDFWYGPELGDDFVDFRTVLESRFGKSFADLVIKRPTLRAIFLRILGQGYDFIVPEWNRYGRRFVILQWLTGGPRSIVLEFIDIANLHMPTRRTKIYKFLARYLIGPAMRSRIAKIQLMTEWERDSFASLYGMNHSRMVCIRWPMAYSTFEAPEKSEGATPSAPYVFSSGRACCDWDTVFAAAKGTDWPLTVVCAGRDREHVDHLNADGRALVMSDISLAEHNRLLADASLFILSLEERMTSAGQIRLGDAIAAGTPVVATKIKGLEEYLVDGRNGLAIPVGDSDAMRAAVTSLFENEEARLRLAQSAKENTQDDTRARYFQRIAEMVRQVAH